MTSVSMKRPFPMNDALDAYKYDCLELGFPQEYFHAAEDNRLVRERVFNVIGAHVQDMRVDSLIVEKRKTGPALRAARAILPRDVGIPAQARALHVVTHESGRSHHHYGHPSLAKETANHTKDHPKHASEDASCGCKIQNPASQFPRSPWLAGRGLLLLGNLSKARGG